MELIVRVSPLTSSARWAAVVLLTAGNLLAQISTATLTGSVIDGTGAAVAGATVQAKSNSTQLVRNATADDKGEYVIPDLAPGHYNITFRAAGFKAYIVPDIELLVAQRAQINAK